MSEHSRKVLASSRSAPDWRATFRQRWPYYAGVAVLALLVIAYIDAGEEPIHPIVQPVNLENGE